MVQVNVASLVQLTRLFLPGMLARGYGRILNLGSTGSFAPTPQMAVYGATKAFVLWFSEALGEELRGTPIRVTALCPGVTRTGFQERANVADTRLVAGPGLSAERVAREGFEALMRGRSVVVPGFWNWLMAQSVRFTPRTVALRLSNRLLQGEE
jgi:short-subunit dehydrogenase